MKTIKLGYSVYKTREFTIPDAEPWRTFFTIWEKEEFKRTPAEWDFLKEYCLGDFIFAQTGEWPADPFDVDEY